MFVVTVTFTIHAGRMPDFLPLMQANAAASLGHEPGCHRFDVCRDGDEVFLYELYSDEPAFETHKQKAHFRDFDAATADMVAAKAVRTWRLLGNE